MTWPQSELPLDVAGCHALIRQLQSELAGYQETVAAQQETIDALAAENKLLKRSLFGSRRERFTEDPAQGLLFDFKTLGPTSAEQATDEPEVPPSKPKRTSKGRQRRVLPDFMPREEERHHLKDSEIPESMRDNPLARRFFKHVGERIEIIPAQLKVVDQLQEVIVLDQPDETSTIIAAQRPPTLIQSFVGPSVLAYLTVSRFADHLPYYRLENILGRSGLRIDRSTQWRWMHRVAQGISPLVELMWKRTLLSQVIAMDDTPVYLLVVLCTLIYG
jgi:transposase